MSRVVLIWAWTLRKRRNKLYFLFSTSIAIIKSGIDILLQFVGIILTKNLEALITYKLKCYKVTIISYGICNWNKRFRNGSNFFCFVCQLQFFAQGIACMVRQKVYKCIMSYIANTIPVILIIGANLWVCINIVHALNIQYNQFFSSAP